LNKRLSKAIPNDNEIQYIGVHIVTQNKHTFSQLHQTLTTIQIRTTNLHAAQIKEVLGGTPRYDDILHLDRIKSFTPQDYAQTIPYELWKMQRPLERQTVM